MMMVLAVVTAPGTHTWVADWPVTLALQVCVLEGWGGVCNRRGGGGGVSGQVVTMSQSDWQ